MCKNKADADKKEKTPCDKASEYRPTAGQSGARLDETEQLEIAYEMKHDHAKDRQRARDVYRDDPASGCLGVS